MSRFGRFLIANASAEFDPLAIASLEMWYDVTDADTLTLVSGNVSQILDKSGNGKTLVQASAGSRPAYSSSGGANNKPYLTITGTKNIGITGLDIPKPYSIYVVMKNTSFMQQGLVYQLGDNFTHGLAQYTNSGQQSLTLVANTAWRPLYNNFFFTDKWFANTAIFGTEVFLTFRSSYIAFNKSKNYLFHDNPGSSAISRFYIGGTVVAANAQVSEILVFNEKLSDLDDRAVKKYLVDKYALPYQLGAFFHGDSITWGANGTTPELDGYAQKAADGIGALCYNYGQSGTSVVSTGSGNSLQELYPLSLGGDSRDYVFFAYGTNDTYSTPWINAYKAVIQAYIDAGKDPAKLVLLTPPYQSIHATKYATMVPALEAMATELGIQFINIYAATLAAGGDTLLSDGTHPTNAGHTVIANTIIDALT